MRRYFNFLSRPSAAYLIILTSVVALISIGLVMVLSASSVISFEQTGATYSIFLKQLGFLIFGLFFTYFASKLELEKWEKVAWYGMPISLVGLALPFAPVIGRTINDNKSWIAIGSFTLQPSEFAKFAFIIFAALQLKKFGLKFEHFAQSRELDINMLGYLLPAGVIGLGIILKGKDLGNAIIYMAIIGGMIFIGGLALSRFSLISIVGLAIAAGYIVKNPNRLHRFQAVLHPFDPHVYKFAGWQTAHSVMGLASGGLFGVGLGASRQKWGNLTEANTDFIFSVLGEELGLLGTLVVLCLFAALLYGIFRTALNTRDAFARYGCAGVGIWFLIQITINVASAIGIFPVVGVTLPFISYGGSSLVANLIGIAFVLNVVRRDPKVIEEISVRKVERKEARLAATT